MTGRRTLILVAVMAMLTGITGACSREDQDANLFCDEASSLILAAQAVPGASSVPCVDAMPAGWSIGATRYENDRIEIEFESRRAPIDDMTLRFETECDPRDARPLETGAPFEAPTGATVLTDQRTIQTGVTYHMYVVGPDTCTTIDIELETTELVTGEDFPTLTWVRRSEIADLVAAGTDGRLELDP